MHWSEAYCRDRVRCLLGVIGRKRHARATNCHGRGKSCRTAVVVMALGIMWPMSAHCVSLDAPVSNGVPRPHPIRPAPPGIGGQVRSQSGQPLHGVVVLVVSLDKPGPPIPDLANATDRAGHFFWALPPGRYRLTFVRDGRKIATRDVAIPDRRRIVPVDVVVSDRANP